MYKQAKEMQKSQELEDAKSQAADLAVNKQILRDGDFDKILKDIENAALNQKKDRFVKKYGFVACNEFYKDKTGLPDLP